MLLCRPAATPISTPGSPFEVPANCSLLKSVKPASCPLSTYGCPIGNQPVSPMNHPASPGMRTSMTFGGAGGSRTGRCVSTCGASGGVVGCGGFCGGGVVCCG